MGHVIKARMDSSLLSQIKKTRYIQTLEVDVFFGEASFVSPDEMMLDVQRLRGENFAIAATPNRRTFLRRSPQNRDRTEWQR
jgi:hypothetical protein